MRATWNGNFTIGTLSVPVQLYAATKPDMPSFTQLHADDLSPITRMLICQKDGEEVSYNDTIRAVKYGDRYIQLTDDEIVNRTSSDPKSLAVRQFSDPKDIDPIYYDKPYYIIPNDGGEFAYSILRQAFIKAEKVAIVTYVLYEKQRIGVVSVADGVLRLQQLRFADMIVPRSELPIRSLSQPAPQHVSSAVGLMNRYSSPLFIEDYQNEQAKAIHEIVERRAKGLEVKKRRRVTHSATRESDVVSSIRSMLSNDEAKELPSEWDKTKQYKEVLL